MSQPFESPDPSTPSAPSAPPAGDGAVPEEGLLSVDEVIDIVDEDDHVIGTSPRGEAYAQGLRHRCAFILARDPSGRIFVHRRTARKLVFPSLYDIFVGGVVGAGESYDATALREAEEELGVSGLPQPTRLFKFLFAPESGPGSWWSTVYEVRVDVPVRPQVEEVAWHDFLTEEELERRLTEWEFVPDGLDAYQRLARWRKEG
ncbi:Isopentenyldiphosphate isomerase [Actinacidiphila yanglinensis]|uniref:Isopentenyldiphosphate isomerase n=1 Tax=Actinacidiphila yanglinensis TaxID=310779 RepID=A0A1H6BAR1_9ACTN|nr:NUDIX domain-containing protein [Actinacidiphila yanglinensis]SEG57933.1 Isopentenyldiphosphate isomerase [Actinacidiphila yanglinensis]